MRIHSAPGLLLAGLALAAGAAQAQVHSGVHPAPAIAIQVIKAFDNPESAIFSADGQFVFIGNAAEIGDRAESFGWTEGEGYIGKLRVTPSGRLEMVEERLIEDLTAPLGMGVLPVATGSFPAGTIFVCIGAAPLVDSNGETVTDGARLRTGVMAFDVEGTVLGTIDMGSGSPFHEMNGAPVALTNALGFDSSGNLYVVDTAFGGGQFDPPFEDRGGVWKIPHESIDALAVGAEPPAAPSFTAIPGKPDGVEVSPLDGMIYVNTVGPVAGVPDPAGGGIYAFADIDGALPEPFDSRLGALDGLDFTDGGTMLNTQIKGDVPASLTVNCPGAAATVLEIEPSGSMTDLTGPADIAIRRLDSGEHLVVVPELFARDATPGDDEVTVLVLPAGFDAACG